MEAIPSSPYTPTTSTIPSSPYSTVHRLKEQLLLWMVHLPLALCSPSPSLLWCPSLAPLLPPNT